MTSALAAILDVALDLAPEDRLVLAERLAARVDSSHDTKLAALRAAIREGFDAIARGEFVDVTADDVSDHIAGLSARAART